MRNLVTYVFGLTLLASIGCSNNLPTAPSGTAAPDAASTEVQPPSNEPITENTQVQTQPSQAATGVVND